MEQRNESEMTWCNNTYRYSFCCYWRDEIQLHTGSCTSRLCCYKCRHSRRCSSHTRSHLNKCVNTWVSAFVFAHNICQHFQQLTLELSRWIHAAVAAATTAANCNLRNLRKFSASYMNIEIVHINIHDVCDYCISQSAQLFINGRRDRCCDNFGNNRSKCLSQRLLLQTGVFCSITSTWLHIHALFKEKSAL